MKEEKNATSAGNPNRERLSIRKVYHGTVTDYLGDAIEIARLDSTRIPVTLHKSYAVSLDEFQGRLSLVADKARFERWMQDYDATVRHFVASNIEDQSSPGVSQRSKVGFVSLSQGGHNDTPKLTVRPVNHLVTTAFNKRLGADRVFADSSPKAHELWKQAYTQAVADFPDKIACSFPSQLHLEVALLTTDEYVPITQKHSKTSVYALRNGKQSVSTCGIEAGLDWKNVVTPADASADAELDLTAGFYEGVRREFPMEDWDERKNDIDLKMALFAIENLHMNTALVGVCSIPYSKNELISALKGRRCGGLDHAALDFIPASQCAEYVEKYKYSTAWHATAMMRLNIVADSFSV